MRIGAEPFRRGRKRGFRLLGQSLANHRAAVLAGKLKRLKHEADVLSQTLSPNRSAGVSKIFGFNGPGGTVGTDVALVSGTTVCVGGGGTHAARSFVRDHDRGLFSHHRAQAEGIANFARKTPESDCIVATNVFDDATMWVAKPCMKNPTEVERSNLEKLFEKRLGARGKKVCLPVLNLCETLYHGKTFEKGSDDGRTLNTVMCGLDVASPAQALPEANTSTIRNRWSRWSVCIASGVGASVGDTEGHLGQVMDESPWKTILMQKDNLVLNDCIVALEEERLAALGDGEDNLEATSLLPCACCSHGAVLATKLLMTSLDNVPSNLVTLGHILESGRSETKFREGIRKEVGDGFRYRRVDRLPLESIE